MKKNLRNMIIILYAVVAIAITICLLSYNEYKVTEFGTYSLVIVNNNKIQPDYNKGDLVIVDRDKDILIGDKVFFYKAVDGEMTISLAQVIDAEAITDTETTYMLEGDKPISSSHTIGTSRETQKIEKLGTILGILESKWGFLILVVLPALLAFLYEIFKMMAEFRGSRD